MAKGDDLDPARHRAGQARHELQRVAPFQPDDRPRRAIMSPLQDHPHIKHEQADTTLIYLHADLALKERALARTTPPDTKPGRYKPSDQLLAFLEAL
jgi:hypothetical protein